MKKLAPEIIEAYKKLDVTCVSDALDRYGIYGAFLGIHPVCPGTTLCGQAFTVQQVLCTGERETTMDFLDDVRPGEVVVMDNAGREDCTVWGDLMSIVAKRNHVAGTVIDGVCRDIPAIREMKYPIFSKNVYMVTGKQRVYLEAVNVPVFICGVRVNPGDLIMGDDSGVLSVPFEKAEEILKAAQDIDMKEKIIEKFIADGATLKEAREKTGYYLLQNRIE